MKIDSILSRSKRFAVSSLLAVSFASINSTAKDVDAFVWLEDVEGEKALNWVKEQNKMSQSELEAQPEFKKLYEKNLEVYQSNDRIAYISKRGEHYYNFWQDEKHIRGIYRRTSLAEYKKEQPKWETVIDFDALSKEENENWVYKGMSCLYPQEILCLVQLSRGGADATVIREFNLKEKLFVKNGFTLPEAKSSVSWKDKDTVYVGTDFGKDSMTNSGYSRISKIWKRGTSLDSATLIFEGKKESVWAGAFRWFSKDGHIDVAMESPTFFTTHLYVNQNGKLLKLDKPDSATVSGYFNKNLYIELKENWQRGKVVYPASTVIYAPLKDIIEGKAHYNVFVKSTDRKSFQGLSFTRSSILVNWLDDVKSVLEQYTPKKDGTFEVKQVPFPKEGAIGVFGTDEDSDDFFVTYESFLQPDSLYLVEGQTLKMTKLKQLPAFFDASPYEAEQQFATSKDGTQVPYFIVKSKSMKLDGTNPTLLYGYGGFEVSLRPNYSATIGIDWLEQGGVYVLGNIRGGGEYGPAWHQAALKMNRHKAYEDFEAIANDLIAKKITSPKHLGIRGGSNGGLLMGAMTTRSPELFNAVVCSVPLLDMIRFHTLLAGHSWMGEYGNPEVKEERDYLLSYSPYHNIKKDMDYPRVLFTTSTRDDRVHPGHARKMVAKMKAMGHDVMYYENMEGGHGGAANQKQSAYLEALIYTYLKHHTN